MVCHFPLPTTFQSSLHSSPPLLYAPIHYPLLRTHVFLVPITSTNPTLLEVDRPNPVMVHVPMWAETVSGCRHANRPRLTQSFSLSLVGNHSVSNLMPTYLRCGMQADHALLLALPGLNFVFGGNPGLWGWCVILSSCNRVLLLLRAIIVRLLLSLPSPCHCSPHLLITTAWRSFRFWAFSRSEGSTGTHFLPLAPLLSSSHPAPEGSSISSRSRCTNPPWPTLRSSNQPWISMPCCSMSPIGWQGHNWHGRCRAAHQR